MLSAHKACTQKPSPPQVLQPAYECYAAVLAAAGPPVELLRGGSPGLLNAQPQCSSAGSSGRVRCMRDASRRGQRVANVRISTPPR